MWFHSSYIIRIHVRHKPCSTATEPCLTACMSQENLFQTRSDTNPAIQSQKMVRCLKFQSRKKRDCSIFEVKTKLPISSEVISTLVCLFAFAIEKNKSSYERAHLQCKFFLCQRAIYTSKLVVFLYQAQRYKIFSCSTRLSMKCIQLINVPVCKYKSIP